MSTAVHPMAKYLRPGKELTTACPGCGDGQIAHSILRAIDQLELDIDDFVFVCGIGCAGWIPSPYFAADTLQPPTVAPSPSPLASCWLPPTVASWSSAATAI